MDLNLQARLLGFDGFKGMSDLAHFGADTRRLNLRLSRAAYHQTAGEEEGRVVTAGFGGGRRIGCFRRLDGSVRRQFAHGNGFAGQQRFIEQQVLRTEECRVGRDAVAFRDDDDVLADDLPAGNLEPFPVADDPCARAGEIAQRFQHVLAARFLNDGDGHRERGEQ